MGMSPITNPTIAVLKVHYDKFMEYHNYQKSLKNRSQRAQDQLNIKRTQVDGVIQQIWNEVENTFNDLPEEMKREKASEYGLVYVFRKNELNSTNLFPVPQDRGDWIDADVRPVIPEDKKHHEQQQADQRCHRHHGAGPYLFQHIISTPLCIEIVVDHSHGIVHEMGRDGKPDGSSQEHQVAKDHPQHKPRKE